MLAVTSVLTTAPIDLLGGSRAGASSGNPANLSGLISLTHAGLERDYMRYVPSGMPAGQRPLVLVLHGGTSGGAEVLTDPQRAESHWMALADTDKFIVAYPNGLNAANGTTERMWDDCGASDEDTGDRDDAGFLNAVIDDIDQSYDVDLSRIYITGVSRGGMMTFRMAHEYTHRFAAASPVVANQNIDLVGECRSADRPLTLTMMSGDADPLMPWEGCSADCESGGNNQGETLSAEASRDWWINHNSTGSTVDDTVSYPNVYLPDGPGPSPCTAASSWVERTRYLGGADATKVAFFRVHNGGHQVPSSDPAHFQGGCPLWGLILGPQNRDIEGVAEIWAQVKNVTRTVTYFGDGFDSGTFSAGSWITSGNPTVSTAAAFTDTHGARLRGTSTITRQFSTSGYSSVRLRYARRTTGLDAGENLYVEWSTNGITWHNAEATRSTSWVSQDIQLPPGAAGQTGFRVRFRTNANSTTTERGEVDNVTIIGV